jgi:hypothetical protein
MFFPLYVSKFGFFSIFFFTCMRWILFFMNCFSCCWFLSLLFLLFFCFMVKVYNSHLRWLFLGFSWICLCLFLCAIMTCLCVFMGFDWKDLSWLCFSWCLLESYGGFYSSFMVFYDVVRLSFSCYLRLLWLKRILKSYNWRR